MPKTIINEIDNTTAGTADYENFAVVVPGVVASGTWEDASGNKHSYGYDEYDESVFDENGIYECSSQKAFKTYIGKVKSIAKCATAQWPEDPEHSITEDEFNAYKNKGQMFTLELITDESEKFAGKDKVKNDLDWFKVTKVADDAEYVADSPYIIITDEGSDDNQNGNQIAYELLGLGYTVLYKKLSSDASEMDASGYFDCLLDKSNYDFRYITTGGYVSETAYEAIVAIAKQVKETIDKTIENNGRGDCTALIDIDETGMTAKTVLSATKTYVDGALADCQSKYAAFFLNRVTYKGDAEDVDVYQNLTFPASFHYLACAAYARNELSFNEWYAVAGHTRGFCDRTVAYTTFKLGEIAANALQPRAKGGITAAVNFVRCERGTYYLFGNRTAHTLGEELIASDFLNIRQLCSTIKKELYMDCAEHRFDPNSDILWASFCNYLRPTLEGMKGDQGITDYRIIKVVNDKKALLTAKVRIVPIEAVEDFVIDVYLEDSISGIAIATEEE